jgi:hypothetical protein
LFDAAFPRIKPGIIPMPQPTHPLSSKTKSPPDMRARMKQTNPVPPQAKRIALDPRKLRIKRYRSSSNRNIMRYLPK